MTDDRHVYDYNGRGCRHCPFPMDSAAHWTAEDIMYGNHRTAAEYARHRCDDCGLYYGRHAESCLRSVRHGRR